MIVFFFLFPFADNKKEESLNLSWVSLITNNNQKAWVMTGNTVNGEDALSELQACELDNQYIFSVNGQLNVIEGMAKCSESDDDFISTHSWTVSEESAQLFWDEEIYKVKSISDKQMVLVFVDQDYVVEATLTAVEN